MNRNEDDENRIYTFEEEEAEWGAIKTGITVIVVVCFLVALVWVIFN